MKTIKIVLASALMLFSVSAFCDFDVRLQQGTISAVPLTTKHVSVFVTDSTGGKRQIKIFTYRVEMNSAHTVFLVLESVTSTDFYNPVTVKELKPNPNQE